MPCCNKKHNQTIILASDNKFIALILAVIAVVSLEILSIFKINIPMPYAPFIFGVLILTIGKKVLLEGLEALKNFNFASINLLMLIAVIGAFYLKEYLEAAVVIVLFVLSEKLEDIGIENSKSALNDLINKIPKIATLKSGEKVAIENIAIGTIIQIRPGDLIPLDGKIISGETSVDESAITGEFIPKDKNIGDVLFAGTLNKNGFVEIMTTKLSNDTTFANIIRLTFDASEHKPEIQKFIQKFASYYTPFVITLSTAFFLVSILFGYDFNKSLETAITLLVISCPCALVISTPVAIYAAIGNASKRGIIIKGGKFIEALAKLKTIAFDKTRTITFGNPIVSDVIPFNGTTREELLTCASGAGVLSEHPLSQAMVNATKQDGFEPHAATEFKSITGKGVIAKCLVCADETIYLGKLSFIKEYQDTSHEVEELIAKLSSQGKTSIVVSFGNGISGIIALTDEIKENVIDVIQEIKALNIEPIMLTGDNKKVADYIASRVGITHVFSDLLPDGKSIKIQELLTRYQYVGMVGDGINDAPALALSTVGIAMGSAGSDTAIEIANIALMNDNLSLIPFVIRLSRATLQKIKINTVSAISVKLAFIILTVFGYSNLVFAIAADVGVTLIVIVSSLRLRRFVA